MAIKGARERGSSWLRGKWLRERGRDQKQTAVWGESAHKVCSTDSWVFINTTFFCYCCCFGLGRFMDGFAAFMVLISEFRWRYAHWTKVKQLLAWIEVSFHLHFHLS